MQIKSIKPFSGGWLQAKLNDEELNHLWKMCKTPKKNNYKDHLAGHNYKSQLIEDKDDWFWDNVLTHLCNEYAFTYGNIYSDLIKISKQLIFLSTQHESEN